MFGALQDPRKEVINLRNLFPTRIALRLDESEQVDMVLGDGARDRGARCDEISSTPQIGAGVGGPPGGAVGAFGTFEGQGVRVVAGLKERAAAVRAVLTGQPAARHAASPLAVALGPAPEFV